VHSLPEAIDAEERDKVTHFGKFGGQCIPETLSEAFLEIEENYNQIKSDPDFLAELDVCHKDFVGGPTPLHLAERLTELCGGAKIWLKRENLAHTEVHKINNAIGHCLLAKCIGKPRIIAENGAGRREKTTPKYCKLKEVAKKFFLDDGKIRMNTARKHSQSDGMKQREKDYMRRI